MKGHGGGAGFQSALSLSSHQALVKSHWFLSPKCETVIPIMTEATPPADKRKTTVKMKSGDVPISSQLVTQSDYDAIVSAMDTGKTVKVTIWLSPEGKTALRTVALKGSEIESASRET